MIFMINEKFERIVKFSQENPLIKIKNIRVDTRYNIVSIICYFNNKLWKEYGNKYNSHGMFVSRFSKYIVFTLR